jgi:hypothetical protein
MGVTHEPLYSEKNEIWYSKRTWAYLKLLLEYVFYFTKLLNMAEVDNFEVMFV